MAKDRRRQLSEIKQFKQLITFLRDEMGWPIDAESDFDDLTYEYTTAELGIDEKSAAEIKDIMRLRPLSPNQPWGVFFVTFEPKKLPVIALRRILSQVALKKRASANPADRSVWAQEDLLFISNYGEGDDRQITLAHFSAPSEGHTLPTLKVLGWDSKDTVLHLDAVARELTEQLSWPSDETDVAAWRAQWSAAFTVGHQEVITTSKVLSIRLAQLARDIRDRISAALAIETKDGPLTKLMKAFQDSLIHDLTPEDFADMYAQTITYGLLSSRIVDPKNKSVDGLTTHMRLSPFLKELMETFLEVNGRKAGTRIDFDELGVGDVVELLDRSNMEAVVADFGDKNPQEDPVIHFYELFLKAYDAKKRMSRGVFYTPRPVVSYIVRSVDELLRTQFGLVDGLADTATWGEMAIKHKGVVIPDGVSPNEDFVQILDPATGTGTFLVEVIELIHNTLVAKWKAEGHDANGISRLWDKYVPKHLLTRLHGYELLMAPYAIAHLKMGLKLYETGYGFKSDERARVYLTNSLEPANDFTGQFEYSIPALAHESKAVNAVKTNRRFTVVIGNPPYSVYSSNNIPSIRLLMDEYKQINGVPLGEVRIAPLMDDYCKFIRFSDNLVMKSNIGIIGMITNHSFLTGPVFRGMRHSLMTRYQVSVLDLHGNYFRGDLAQGDTNVFEIKPGVAISVLSCRPEAGDLGVRYAEMRGSFADKLRNLTSVNPELGVSVETKPPLFYWTEASFSNDEYSAFASVSDIFSIGTLGMMTGKDNFMIAWTKEEMTERMKDIADLRISDEIIREKYSLEDSRDWVLKEARSAGFNPALVVPVNYRPFDIRWTYYHKHMHASLQRRVNDLMVGGDNIALCVPRQLSSLPFEHAFVTCNVTEMCCVSNRGKEANRVFPLNVAAGANQLLSDLQESNLASQYLASQHRLLSSNGKVAQPTPEEWFGYVYAILHSPRYRSRYEQFLMNDFPRIPMLGSYELFHLLSKIGRQLIGTHLLRSVVWDQKTATFIGNDQAVIEKISWSADTVWVNKVESMGFRGVSEAVWNFHVGGYQVCEKWLKDRKGRTLSDEDIAHYQKIVVALSETIRLMKEIDEVIERHGGWPGAFAGETAAH